MEDFDQVYAQYFSYVYKFALSLCGDEHTAEELTQETFFKALKNIDSFKGQSKISSWLCQIAKNTYYTNLKKEQKSDSIDSYNFVADINIEKQMADSQTAYEIHKVLHNLKEPYKEVFRLRTFADLSFNRIGTLFGKSETWARVTYYRAKTMIKERIR
ncbi:MAG: RNA polymerase sigma factor [Oscillospiraceae bacterium]|nr:RNA polymerase sigma factor [Oscillospiraceae bacterium]MBR6609987.1 RNA polymerase sigma factor [Oscillospiraceae bacterium]